MVIQMKSALEHIKTNNAHKITLLQQRLRKAAEMAVEYGLTDIADPSPDPQPSQVPESGSLGPLGLHQQTVLHLIHRCQNGVQMLSHQPQSGVWTQAPTAAAVPFGELQVGI